MTDSNCWTEKSEAAPINAAVEDSWINDQHKLSVSLPESSQSAKISFHDSDLHFILRISIHLVIVHLKLKLKHEQKICLCLINEILNIFSYHIVQ